MSLSPLVAALLVPPTDLLLPAAVAIWLLPLRPRVARALLAAGLAGLALLSLPFVAQALLDSLEIGLTDAAPRAPPQAIVILSGDVAETRSGQDVGALTLERERVGAALSRRSMLPILVTGGTLGGGTQSLGALMAASLSDDFTVKPRWVETEAQDTRENARFSARLLARDGVGSIYLVTHAWHMKRALLAFAGTGLAVTPAPVRLDAWPPLRWRAFVPQAHAWLTSYYALHEWIGCLAAWLRLR